MPAVPFQRTFSRPSNALRLAFSYPGRRVEVGVWVLMFLGIVGLRWWVAAHLPTYVWTRDSGSYLSPVVTALDGGQWVTSARRGPVYSLFLGGVLRLGGTLKTVADVQAWIGGLTAGLTLAAARCWLGRRAFWPLAVCSVFYVLYSLPIELERLIRNETLLVFFATVAFGAWFYALRRGSVAWIAVSGLFMGLLQLLKGIFPIFPLIVLGLVAWNWRRRPRRGLLLAGTYAALCVLPILSSKLYSRFSGTTRPAEPEDGQMFYGRTAQWTYLEPDGILPDLKARIHDQAQAYIDRYRRTGKLENNEIVKRTVVPTLKTVIINERGGTLVEVNHVSWQLGLEAVRHHPGAYLRQFFHDLFYLNFISAQRMTPFEPKGLANAGRDARTYAAAENRADGLTTRIFDLENSRHALHAGVDPHGSLQRFARFMRTLGQLRLLSPIFLTTLLLPLLTYTLRDRHRSFWLGNTILWFYYLVLLSTVGRPLDRYLMPVVPIMFWTIATAAALGWDWYRRRRPSFRS